jgi:hypothetical protein
LRGRRRCPSSHAQVDDDIDSAANIFLTALNDPDWRRTVESLLQADLLDELRLEIDPVVAGTGARFFGEGRASKHLQLATSKITGNGVAILTYRPVRS